MEHYDSTLSKFLTKKWIEVYDLSSGQNSVNKNIRFKTSMLTSYLCDYSEAYIVVKETIIVEGDNDDTKRNKKLTFKNNAPFRSCISITHNLDNAEDLYIVMLTYSLSEYSDDCYMTSGSLGNYYRDEANNDANENNAASKKK